MINARFTILRGHLAGEMIDYCIIRTADIGGSPAGGVIKVDTYGLRT
jgi:hypothetical protein